MWVLIMIPLVSSVQIFTKTEPAIQFDVFNVPVETNFFGHFKGYTVSGSPELENFHQFEDTIVDKRSQVYKINKN